MCCLLSLFGVVCVVIALSVMSYYDSEQNPSVSISQAQVNEYPNLDIIYCFDGLLSPIVGDPFKGPVAFRTDDQNRVTISYPRMISIPIFGIQANNSCFWFPLGKIPFAKNEVNVFTIRGFSDAYNYSFGYTIAWDLQTQDLPVYPTSGIISPLGWIGNNLYLTATQYIPLSTSQFTSSDEKSTFQHNARLDVTAIYKGYPSRPPWKYPLQLANGSVLSLNFTFDLTIDPSHINANVTIVKESRKFDLLQVGSTIVSSINICLTILGVLFPVIPLIISARTCLCTRKPIKVLDPENLKMINESEYFNGYELKNLLSGDQNLE